METNDLTIEKLYHVLLSDYNMNEANALCRMINDKDIDLNTFRKNFAIMMFQSQRDISDGKYYDWLESLSV